MDWLLLSTALLSGRRYVFVAGTRADLAMGAMNLLQAYMMTVLLTWWVVCAQSDLKRENGNMHDHRTRRKMCRETLATRALYVKLAACASD